MTIFYEIPIVTIILMFVLNIIEVISGLLKIYKKEIFNKGMIIEGFLHTLITIIPLILIIREKNHRSENEINSDKEFEQMNTGLGWLMIGAIGLMFFVNYVLRCFGRSGT